MEPVVLIVLDGFGLAPPGPGNAVELAATPRFDDVWARFPHTTLSCTCWASSPTAASTRTSTTCAR
jgi:bisphosphoglycerate-independent phosphoglycerate mutase (AlkP superfamily)